MIPIEDYKRTTIAKGVPTRRIHRHGATADRLPLALLANDGKTEDANVLKSDQIWPAGISKLRRNENFQLHTLVEEAAADVCWANGPPQAEQIAEDTKEKQ